MTASPPGRHESLDVLRGIVMLLMLFVNDVGGVDSVPWWLKHYAPDLANGMTITDVVFPAFLFVVGMSVPVALGRRLDKGEPATAILAKVLLRTAALLTMGLVMVNMRGWGWWPVLALLGLMAAFGELRRPAGVRRLVTWALRLAGITLLAWLVWQYPAFFPGQHFDPQWWGILGLIGWAYLVCSVVYLMMRRVPSPDVAGVVAVGMLLLVFVAGAKHEFGDLLQWGPMGWISRWVDPGSMIGTHGAVAVLGVLLGVGLRDGSSRRRAGWLMVGTLVAGLLLYPTFGVNKNIATPSWGLWSASLTAGLYLTLAWLMDRFDRRSGSRTKGRAQWARRWLSFVGGSALLLYLLQPLWFRGWSMAGLSYGALAPDAYSACLRALIAAAILSGVAGVLAVIGYRLKV
jgi:heparan-alpha-glucosaminide N-acetyltransferase